MNVKIPIKRFADKVAVTAGCTPAEAEKFIKDLFALITSGLREGETVKVKGLGVFSLTSTPDDPVHFTPEPEWADTVNAPFSMFEPVELNPRVSDSMLAAATAPATDLSTPAPQPAAPHYSEPLSVSEPPKEPVSEPEFIKIEQEPLKPVQEPPTGPQPPTSPSVPIAEPEPEAVPVIEPKSEPVRAPQPESIPEEEETVQEEYVPEGQSSSSFTNGFFIGLIVGLALGALALFCYVMFFDNQMTDEIEPLAQSSYRIMHSII